MQMMTRSHCELDAFIVDDPQVWGCIVVLLINKSIEPYEEQKVLTSSLDKQF
jgi:hypothetical protein